MPTPALKPSTWQRFDAQLYRLECALVCVATAIMTAVVCMSIAWRLTASPHSIIATWLEQAFGPNAQHATTASAISWIGGMVLCSLGFVTAKRHYKPWQACLYGALSCAVLIASAHALVWALPGGVVFSQRLALTLLMWVVMLGCSMAAYKRGHIALEAMQRVIPQPLQRIHSAISLLCASIFLAVLIHACSVYMLASLQTWLSSNMLAARFDSLAIPYWCVQIAVPIGLSTTLVRFTTQAIAIMRGKLPPYQQATEQLAPSSAASEEPA